jgi:deoxyribodipyrimidine photo-lyase
MYTHSLFIFRRDLRLIDNTALLHACKNSQKVSIVFFFDPRQRNGNEYFSNNAFQFMVSSLLELREECRNRKFHLHILKGKSHEKLKEILSSLKFEAVYANTDYTPFAAERDQEIQDVCGKEKVNIHLFHDALLFPPGKIIKDDGTPYTVFTPFYKKSQKQSIPQPEKTIPKNITGKFLEGDMSDREIQDSIQNSNTNRRVKGGRKEALKILENLPHNYDIRRDIPSESGTTYLSAHHKFGTVSIRETYHRIKKHYRDDHMLLSELTWRDFFTHIAFHFPHVFGQAFRNQYNNLKWENNKVFFDQWKKGETGYPIVDAGMRELNTTGYMHNRVRMITASFLVKDLLIDWRWGEKYFAQKLIDYDPSVNNGNWQWAASTGCDAQPYFRIFNPKRQQERFDPQCIYIKKWVPELISRTPKEIHAFEKKELEGYKKPIITHSKQVQKAKSLFLALKAEKKINE